MSIIFFLSGLALEFIHPESTPKSLFVSVEALVARRFYAITLFLSSFLTYVVTRAADRALARLISFALIALVLSHFLLSSQLYVVALIPHFGGGLLLQLVVGIAALLASIFHDFWHPIHAAASEAPSSPRRGRPKKIQ